MYTLLGIKIDNLKKEEILEKIESFLNKSTFHQIATVNPEFILQAQNNSKFKNVLNNCSLNVADGIGLFFAFFRFGKILKTRFTGADLMMEILSRANEKKLSIFLACNKNGLSTFQEVRTAMLKIYPTLEIFGEDIEIKNNTYNLKNNRCQLLLCNFGAPYQELFINSQKYANIRLAMGVGGSFDFLTGKVTRAPKIMRVIGFEWLWRLILNPKYRWKKILQVLIIFPLRIILNK